MTRLRLRIRFGPDALLGPGRADLLELVAETGSISAAGARMGMSYRRAWGMVEALNATFRAPLVETVRGGAQGGGARLTEAGREVLARYRAIEARLADDSRENIAALEALLAEKPHDT
jgi:molybdate transport system regulatory protein